MIKAKISTLFSIRSTLKELKDASAFSDSPKLWFWADQNLSKLHPAHGETKENELSSASQKDKEILKEHQKEDSEGRPVYQLLGSVVSLDMEEGVVFTNDGERDLSEIPQEKLNPVIEDPDSYAEERSELMGEEIEVPLMTVSKSDFFEGADLSDTPRDIDLSVLNKIFEE
jgi:hypothetical protein